MNSNKIFQPTRRNFLLGMLAAPLVVRAASIMPVRSMAIGDGAPLMSMAHPEDFRWGTSNSDINPLALTFTVYGRDEYGRLVVEKILLSPREQARIANARLAT